MLRLMRVLLFVLPFLAGAAGAGPLDDLAAARRATEDVWNRMPLSVQNTVFVAQPAPVIGSYQVRENNVFRPGEKLLVYAEPVGYSWKPVDGGKFEFGFDLDLLIVKPNGDVIAGQQNFQNIVFQNRLRLTELMFNLTVTLSGIPEGDYVMQVVIRDLHSDKRGQLELPFSIAGKS